MTHLPLMKGQPWSKHSHKFNITPDSPVYAEIKHDEIRMHVVREIVDGRERVGMYSYAGKPLANMEAWCLPMWRFMAKYGITELDMGVEVNGNFNDSYRWVRSTKGIPKGLHTADVKFHLYDIPDMHDTIYKERILHREIVAHIMSVSGLPMLMPRHYRIDGLAQLDALYKVVREQGYEGLMVKLPESLYCRSKGLHWFKMKPTETFDGEILVINEAVSETGERLGRAGSVFVKLEDGSFATPAGIPHELGRELWLHQDKYALTGQWVEFKCMERDRQGGYRHPAFIRLREAK